MAHVIWRRILKEEIEKIDKNLIDITYNLIDRGEYKIAIRILEFFVQPQMTHFDESVKRTLIINLAQAYKWSQDKEGCSSTLDSMDWSACEDRFRLAVVVLKEEFEGAYPYMRRLVHDDSFHRIYYKEWPVFRQLREIPKFAEVYEECYKEPFKVEEKVTAKLNEPKDTQVEQKQEETTPQDNNGGK